MNKRGFIRKIFELGLKSGLSFEEKMGVVLTNQMNLLAVIATFLYLGIIGYAGHWSFFKFGLLGLGGYFFTFWLNAKQFYAIARFATLLTANMEITLFATVMGREVGIQWALLPILLGVLIAFNAAKRIYLIIGICLPVVSFIFLEIIDYQTLIPAFSFPFSEGVKLAVYYLNAFIVTGLSVSIFLYHFRITQTQAKDLKGNEAHRLQSSRLARMGFSEVWIKEKYATWQPGLREIMGVPADFQVNMKTFMEIVHPEDKQAFQDEILTAFNKKEEFSFEYKVIRPADGKTIYIRSLGKIFRDKDGNAEIMRAVLQDVTPEREKEATILQEIEKADAANLAKSRFLSNISHEIRTPLHGLLGFAHLLKKTSLDNDQESYVSLMEYSGETLLALIDDLLEVTRIEQGKIIIRPEAFELAKLVDSCMAPYSLQAIEKGLTFQVHAFIDTYPIIFADPIRIKQVLLNLVGNAIKYTREGSVTVDISCNESKEKNGSLTLQIAVSDTGPGIPKEAQDEIFNTFTQLRTDLPESQNGLGLGLSIVHRLVELMGGKVELESSVIEAISTGSLFLVEIPVEVASPQEIKRLEPIFELPSHPFLKVLVAEDNEVNQILIKTILEQENYEVTLASNGEIVVELALNNDFDLILMDVQMPILDGYEATKEIRKHKPHIPIIALSANAYEDDKQKSLEVGMDAHLSKPLQLEELGAHLMTFFPKISAGKV